MKLVIDVPKEMEKPLRQAALDAGNLSATAYVRGLMVEAVTASEDSYRSSDSSDIHNNTDSSKGSDSSTSEVTEQAEVKKLLVTAKGKIVQPTPFELLKQRKAEAAAKFATPAQKPKGE